MKRTLFSFACIAVFFSSCSNSPGTAGNSDSQIAKHDTAPVDNTRVAPTTKPELTGPVSTGLFKDVIASQSVVLVDFAAEWCGPCHQLSPRLDAVEKEMPEAFRLVRIDVDRDMALADSMNITQLPTLLLYKNGEIVWRNIGSNITREEIAARIKAAQ